jgi:hypothetical protein
MAQTAPSEPAGRLAARFRLLTRIVIWITVFATAAVVTRAYLDEPLRRHLERRVNDLLRSSGGFDVVDGRLSFYSDFMVRNGWVDGYVKPFFTDMNVYDTRQDAAKDVGQQVYEALVGGGAAVLQNFREHVATKADLSGPVGKPEASSWQILVGLLRNAVWRALVPGVERQEHRR